MLAYYIGGEETSSRDLMFTDYVGLAALVTSLAGLAVAWKWECFGACLTLVCVAIGAAANSHFVISLLIVIPVTALLFLLSAWLKPQLRSHKFVESI